LGDRLAERRITSRPIFPDSGISNISNSVYYTLYLIGETGCTMKIMWWQQ
jgi:hypothetical protein